MPFETIIALAAALAALLLATVAFLGARRATEEVEGLHDRFDEERSTWRLQLAAVQDQATTALERASQPVLPGEAALRLQDATESLSDLKGELQRIESQLKREGEQRLATEVSLFEALENVGKRTATAEPAPPPAPRRPRRSDSLFETVDFGDDLG